MTHEYKRGNVFAGSVAALRAQVGKPDATLHDAALPCCPLCDRPAVAGRPWAVWCDLAHDCRCDLERPEAYLGGLRRLWAQRMAEPTFLSTLPRRYHAYTLATLERTAGNAKAVAVAPALTRNLYLYGEAGTGKTHAATAIARSLAQGGKTARFWGMVELIAAIRDGVRTGVRPELLHWDVLVIDDVDKLKPTDFVYETLYGVMNSRWADDRVTIYTAQGNPNEAAIMITPDGSLTAADPLASRMAAGHTFKITGTDRRAS